MRAEPLRVSALLADRIARERCRGNPVSGADCSVYHGSWQIMRILELVPAAAQHAAFLLDAFGAAARTPGCRRVLISGTADYSLLAHVLYAYAREGVAPDVTVIDLCETPLLLNRWYAERAGIGITTRACDLRDQVGEPYDLICTHSLLPRYALADRRKIVSRWRDLLRPGGRIVTANRLIVGFARRSLSFAEEQLASVHARVLDRAGAVADVVSRDPRDLAAGIRRACETMRFHPVGAERDLRALFEGEDLVVERLDRTEVRHVFCEDLISSATGGPAIWAETIATRA
jgi:SAM-dependent methyltransferase